MRVALHRRLLRLAMEQHLSHVVPAGSTVVEASMTTGKEHLRDRGDLFLRLFLSRFGEER
jgi:hypothetical protein